MILVALLVVMSLSFLFVYRTFNLAGELRVRADTLHGLNNDLERENQERQAAPAALEESRGELEERVRERTIELNVVNARLFDKIKPIEETEQALRQSESHIAEAQNQANLGKGLSL